jgi:hypothetical protein
LEIKFLQDPEKQIVESNPEAYEYYLRAKHKYEKRETINDTEIARGLLNKAYEYAVGRGSGVALFSAIGDMPYDEMQAIELQGYIAQLNELDFIPWMIHLGDIKDGKTACNEEVYSQVASYLFEMDRPVYIIPGDNEWNDCADPDEAWGFWDGTFGRFHENWDEHPETVHQDVRDENFSFVDDGVLFVGINLVGGYFHDAEEWAARFEDDLAWWQTRIDDVGDGVGAAVLLGHALLWPTHTDFFDSFVASAAAWGKPVLYLHGDGHKWVHDNPWPDASNVTRVMVQAPAPPVLVMVDPSAEEVFTFEQDPFFGAKPRR